MRMFMWRSDYMKEYWRGHIICMAPNVEKARELVVARFLEDSKWESDPDRVASQLAIVKDDIADEPIVVYDDSPVIFISGSA